MTLATLLANQIAKGLDKYGKSLTYVSKANGAYNPATSSVAQTSSSFNFKGALDAVKGDDLNGQVQIGDRKITAAASSFASSPTENDSVIVDGVSWKVVSVLPIYAIENVVSYVIYVRKS